MSNYEDKTASKLLIRSFRLKVETSTYRFSCFSEIRKNQEKEDYKFKLPDQITSSEPNSHFRKISTQDLSIEEMKTVTANYELNVQSLFGLSLSK